MRRVHKSLLPWKAINITYLSVCACAHACVWTPGRVGVCVYVALLIQHATHVRHIVTSSVAPRAPQYFSTFPHKWHNFREKLLKIII